MNRLHCLALPVFFCLGMFSCSPPDQRANEAMDVRDQALLQFSANTDVLVDGILQGYRAAQLQQVEGFYAQDLAKVSANAGADGKVDAAKAVQFLLEADRLRQQRRAQVEDQVAKALATYRESKRDLIIAQKLNQVLRAYENAGVDLTAAQHAAEQLIQILKPQPPAPAR